MSASFFKRGGSAAVKLTVATKHEINQYAQNLSGQGYQLLGTPIEYRQQMTQQQLRESVKGYAHQNGCTLAVEVQDPNPMANPFNPYKYYLFQYNGRGDPPEPQLPPSQSTGGQQGGQTLAQFTCPYCKSTFTSYVNPGQNVLNCPKCRGQSMVDVPVSNQTTQGGGGGSSIQEQLSRIKLRGRYNTMDEMALDTLEVLGKIVMLEGDLLPFDDTGEFLYPFVRMKSAGYQHIGFRKMDVILLKEATHDYKIMGSEQHSQSQANVNPHKDELFSVKVLGGINFMILEEFKALEPDQKKEIINCVYQYLAQYVGSMQA